MSKTVLTIAAHPDDEILGCGGTMARHAENGDTVHVLILAEGVTSRDMKRDTEGRNDELSALRETAVRAGAIVGVSSVLFGGFPDNRMDGVDLLDVVKCVEDTIARFNPDIVYTHHHGDLNVDHRITNRAVMTAARPQPGQSVREIYYFEVPSATGWGSPDNGSAFLPNYYVNLCPSADCNFLEKKTVALNVYHSEMRPFPHARSIEAVEALARWRGAMVGILASEAFVVGRITEV